MSSDARQSPRSGGGTSSLHSGWLRPGVARVLVLGVAFSVALGLTGCAGQPQQSTMGSLSRGPIDRVVVKKSQRRLELVSRGRVVREYRVSLGGSPVGHKVREGDQRTPEGRYVLNWRNPKSNFYKAIHISYPNERDRQVSRQLGYKPGGMIMLHGMPNYVRSESLRRQYANRDWTHGCIALQDRDMDEIWRMVRDGTPIHIVP